MVGHEVTHVFEGTEQQYNALMAAMKEFAAEKGIDWEARVQEMAERYQNVKNADPEKELLADLVGDYLFTDADFVQRLSTEHRGVFQKLFDEIKHLCKLATAGTKEARELEKVKKLFEDAYRTETKKTTNDGGVRYALESKTQQGKLDPRTVTKDDVLALLHQVEDGSISGNTYIPLRIGTPQILIYWADKRNGDTIDNNPIAISADKAHNAMNRNGETSENGGRPNRLTVDEIVAMVENMNDPEYIVYQGGNDRYVEVVKFNRDNGDSAFAVLEIGNNKDAVYMNGYEGGLYNILVTTYPPITGKLKELLNGSQNKVIYDKKKDASQRTSSSTVPSVLNDASFYEDIISEPSAGVKEEKAPSPVYSLSGNEQGSVPAGGYRITGEDIALAPTKEDIARTEQEKERIATAQNAPRNDVGVQGAPDNDVEVLGAPTREDILQMEMEREQNAVADKGSRISLEDYANNESPVWRNVAYNDDATKASVMQSTHDTMVAEGSVVAVTQDVIDTVEQSFPDLRNMKKKERTPILKDAINKLKNNIRQFLTGLSNQNFEFEVNGKVLDAKLYSTGINEVLEKVTQEKANMLYSTEEIFRNARYLYSTPDYDGDPNIYRWNYFYTPVQIGEDTVGVRIAVRDLAKQGESQIYNWGIKKNASLGGVRDDSENRKPYGTSSDASTNNIPENGSGVKYSIGEPVAEKIGAPTREDIARMEQEKERIATAQTAPRNDVGVQGAPDNDVEELGAPTREDILQMEMERELYGDWRMTDPLDRKVEKLYRLMLLERISEEEYNAQLVKADRQYQQRGSRIEEALERIQQAYSKYQGEAVNGAAGGKTNAVTKPLNSYPIEKQSAIRSYLQSVDEQIKSFVKRVKDGDLRFERRKVSDVNERAASDIQELLGIDVSGYTHNINTSGVQHILRRHGKNGKQDTTMSIDDDIARVGWVLDNYDSVELLTKDGEQVYSSEFKDKNNQPVPQIRFIKKIDGTYYVVEAACENEYQKLWVQSAYLQKNEDVTQVSAEGQEANHETYAQGELASPSSDNSIFQISDDVKQEEVEAVLGEKGAYVSKQANALYDEVKGMQKGKRVSNTLSYLLDTLDLSEENKAESYGSLRTALLNIRDNPNQVVNPNSAVEAAAREMLGREYDAMAEDFANAEGVAKSIYTKMESLRTELENNQSLREQSNADFDSEIARLQAEYEAKKNKNTKAANDILRRIERIQRLKSQVDADYSKRIDRLGEQLERISKPEYKTAMQRKAKMEEYTNLMAELVVYNFSFAGTNVRPVAL